MHPLMPSMLNRCIFTAVLFFCSQAHAHDHSTPGKNSQDAVVAAPDNHKVLLENESVRVLETRVAPGERTPIHTHSLPSTAYFIKWSDFVRYDANGKVLLDSRTMKSKPQPGTALWSPALGAHYIQNVGDSELLVIVVEIKPAANAPPK